MLVKLKNSKVSKQVETDVKNLKQNFTNMTNAALVQVHPAGETDYLEHFSLFSLFRSVNNFVKFQKNILN